MGKLNNIKLVISYDGTNYHGWQRQLSGIDTVQLRVEEALAKVLGRETSVRAAGRTDTGVHAVGQVVNFYSDTVIPARRLHLILNNHLPADIRVRRAEVVGDDFDSTLSARSKLYRYTVYNNPQVPPDIARYVYRYYPSCQIEPMQRAAELLVGTHDFASFAGAGNQSKSTVRTVLGCQVYCRFDRIYFDVEGDGFLYHMVRNIVGTLLDVGRGRRKVSDIPDILEAKDRRAAGGMAPALGLCMQWVRY